MAGEEVKAKKSVKKAEKKPASSADNNSFAIIETGGKQYRVAVGDVIKIEKVKSEIKEYKKGDNLIFNKVLLLNNGEVTDLGTPYIEGAKVSGILAEIGRNKKITVIKYKAKSRYFKKYGHRQPYFKVKIDKIS